MTYIPLFAKVLVAAQRAVLSLGGTARRVPTTPIHNFPTLD